MVASKTHTAIEHSLSLVAARLSSLQILLNMFDTASGFLWCTNCSLSMYNCNFGSAMRLPELTRPPRQHHTGTATDLIREIICRGMSACATLLACGTSLGGYPRTRSYPITSFPEARGPAAARYRTRHHVFRGSLLARDQISHCTPCRSSSPCRRQLAGFHAAGSTCSAT